MVTQQHIDYLARLARLELSDEDRKKFQKQLSEILDFVTTLEKVEAKGAEPLPRINNAVNVWREDKVESYKDRDLLLESVPDREGDFVKAKSIF